MTAAQILIVALALIAANLPFATRRIFFLGPFPAGKPDKSLTWRVIELVAMFLLVGAIAAIFESRSYGGVYPQDWQFYAINTCLFIVFAYPGFVVRYLWHRRKG